MIYKFLTIFLVAAIFGAPQKETADFKGIFEKQVAQSCEKTSTLLKQVIQDGEENTPETKIFDLDCKKEKGKERESGTEYEMTLEEELSATLEYYSYGPYLKDYYQFTEDGTKTTATLKEEYKEKSPLKLQEFELHPGTTVLATIHSEIIKTNWFYDISVKITVNFDEEGMYFSHNQETETQVVFFSSKFQSIILGTKVK